MDVSKIDLVNWNPNPNDESGLFESAISGSRGVA